MKASAPPRQFFLSATTCLLFQVPFDTIHAQGTVNFNNNVPGVVVTHVYVGSGTIAGNGPTDTPPGDTQYWGTAEPVSGINWYAQLWGAPGENVPSSSLSPVSPLTTFGTGSQAGFVVPIIAGLTGIPADSPVATLELRVWESFMGRAWPGYGPYQWASGVSPTFNVYNIGGNNHPPPNLVGLQSFSMDSATWIPEPSTLTLLGLCLMGFAVWHRENIRGWAHPRKRCTK